MKIIAPGVDIVKNDHVLLYSSIDVGEGDPPEWNATTNYAEGDRVHNVQYKSVYEALVAGVDSVLPPLNTTKWARVSTMNRWAMFDGNNHQAGKTSSDISNILVYLAPDIRVDSVAVLGFKNVNQIYIRVQNSSLVTIYENTFIPPPCCKDYVAFNLPINKENKIEITLTGPLGETVSVEHVVIGVSEYIGDLQRDITIDTLNFSNLERDEFGYTNIVRRRGVGTISQKLFISATMVERVLQVREKLNAVAAVWISIDENIPSIADTYKGPTTIFGIYKDFNIILDSPIHATVFLELEEI